MPFQRDGINAKNKQSNFLQRKFLIKKEINKMAMKAPVPEIIPQKDIFVGNPDATVRVMEFGEYESEVCAKANEVV